MTQAEINTKGKEISVGDLGRHRRHGVDSRGYSQYPPNYIKPTYLPSKLQEMEESGEMKALEYKPVKAAQNNHTSSVFHDPTVRLKFPNSATSGPAPSRVMEFSDF
ncbi:hypothetical protein GWK47_049340 [Chionoecetes opilio]|uniref:Uncharacterized protein n=1 Tax=Chionoecetes opilio TaxID=41210 RepID=A0A8J4Y3M5_CHIOP|nr:hypothetical protein GWK47_049340 [Chionoecetes opilio]